MNRGKLIVIDGTDGSGKQTQAALLIDALKNRGFDCESIDFPQYKQNFFGGLVRQYLDGAFGPTELVHPKLASVLYAVDRWQSKEKINTWLTQGKTVILDRYYTSNLIHQSTKLSDDELDEFSSWDIEMEFNVFSIPKPDIVIYLMVDPEISMKLIEARGQGNDGHENLNHLTKAAQRCKLLAKKFNWEVVDCSPNNTLLPKEAIAQTILQKTLFVIDT